MRYLPRFEPEWKRRFEKLDNSIKLRIAKKVRQIIGGLPGRHLEHGLPYFVEEVNQYRICYSSDEGLKLRCFYFVGDHKEYRKWIGAQAEKKALQPTSLNEMWDNPKDDEVWSKY